MDNERSAESPFDSVAETVGHQTAEAFELLGNEIRLAILVALWGATDPTTPLGEEIDSGLSFSELRDRVGIRDSGQFNYHLDDWWKAVVLYDGYRGLEIGVYLWQAQDGDWQRSQKYVIRSEEDWEQDKEAIEEFVSDL